MRADGALLPGFQASAESCSPGALKGEAGKQGSAHRKGVLDSLRSLQLLLAEAERTVVLQYLRALMQGRLVCRGADERIQAAQRLQNDAAQLRELFLGLVRAP